MPRQADSSKRYRVKSIFGPTIQGEGTYVGTVVKFLRLAGCNRWSGLEKDREASICRYCDTDFVGPGVERLTAETICERLNALGGKTRTVVISGGEPLLQVDHELLSRLRVNGFYMHLETNGSLPLGRLAHFFDHVTMSPKQTREQTRLERCDDLKILWPPIAPTITPDAFEWYSAREVYIQPIFDASYQENLKAAVELVTRERELRLSLQTHKIIGVE